MLKHKKIFKAIFHSLLVAGIPAMIATGFAEKAAGQSLLQNEECRVEILNGADLQVTLSDGTARVFKPEFTVLYAEENPQKSLRKADLGKNHSDPVVYKVPTWGKMEVKKIDPKVHVMDGFNPETDRGIEQGRTANYFLAASNNVVTAKQAELASDAIQWIFPKTVGFRLAATVRLPAGKGIPEINFTFVPEKSGYYSVGYSGAPAVSSSDMDEMWQPLIWQGKRFPTMPYLSEAFQCSVPTTLVTYQGATVGVLADASAMPFQPIPKSENSKFGVMVRDRTGMARPMLFAPVLGGSGSKMAAGMPFDFKVHLILHKGDVLDTYEYAARNYYGFKDYRRNTTVTLNKTFENIVDYGMGSFSQFIDELRGCNYATDVPGAVKNITGLSPLSLAIVTDNEDIYKKRARPMLEYSWSRDRFLFSTNPEIKGDGTSSTLGGPGAAMSDFLAAYAFSQNRTTCDLKLAEEIYNKPINLILNLDEVLSGNQWQNAMHLYRATGDKKHLNLAVSGADRYLKDRVYTLPTDFSDEAARGMFFWTSFAPQWMELYLFFEMTGEKRFLDAAQKGAREYAQFVWLCPAVPDKKVKVNIGNKAPRYRAGSQYKDMIVPEETVDAWRVSEIGLTSESSPTHAGGHRGIYLTQFAPWMLRIARDAKDPFLHDIARSAVIGRYEGFPGYHMNAGRTTAHEKADFALRSLPELNGVTSLHFNHPWPHAAMIMDYLVSDVYYRSDARIDFPAEYAEGYGYCRSKIYGVRPGVFYDEKNVWLYMPKGLLSSSNVQINYLAGRGNGKLYLMLANQSKEAVATTLTLNGELLKLAAGKAYSAKVWKDNKPAGSASVTNGKVTIDVSAEGFTALAIDDISANPEFQSRMIEKSTPWKKDSEELSFGGGGRAVLFNFGPDLQSVYAFIKATGKEFQKVTLHYACNGKWAAVAKESYPFEFTVEVPRDTDDFRFRYEAVGKNGGTMLSDEGHMFKR